MTDRFKQPERYKLYKAGANKSQEALVWSEESNDFQALKHKLDERTGGEFLIARVVKGKEYVSCAKGWAENSFRIGVLVDPDKLNQRANAAAVLGKIEYKVDEKSSPKNEPEFDYEQSKPEKQVKLRGEPPRNEDGDALNKDGSVRKKVPPPRTNEKGEILNKDGSVRKQRGRPRATPNPGVKPVQNGAKTATFHFRVFSAELDPRGALKVSHDDFQKRSDAAYFAENDRKAFLMVLHHLDKDEMLSRGFYNWAENLYFTPDMKFEMADVHQMAMKAMKRGDVKQVPAVRSVQDELKQLAESDPVGFTTRVEKFVRSEYNPVAVVGSATKFPPDVEQVFKESLDKAIKKTNEKIRAEKVVPLSSPEPAKIDDKKALTTNEIIEVKEETPDIKDIMDAIDAQAYAYGQAERLKNLPPLVVNPVSLTVVETDLPEQIYTHIIDNQREAARRMNNYIKANQELDAVGFEIIERNKEIFELESRLAMLKDSNKMARDRSDALKTEADNHAKSIADLLGGKES